jgi:SAM-dependent methyltransferase
MGQYAEFFRLRVDTSKDEFLLYTRTGSITTKPMSLAARKRRMSGKPMKETGPVKQLRTYLQACELCHSVTPCHEYSYEDLLGLYRDYRSETYNRDRISVEPSYARIAKDVGTHPLETANRNLAVDGFLRKNASQFSGGDLLDYGGSDGQFLPPFVHERFGTLYVYDPSDARLHPSVDGRKVKKIAVMRPEGYSFITCMHVLEHLGNPRAFTIEALRFLAPGGLIYIEVPLALNKFIRDDFAQNIVDMPIRIHEHMNLFDRMGIRGLVASIADLEMVDDAEDVVDFGWTTGLIGRFLARRTVSGTERSRKPQ